MRFTILGLTLNPEELIKQFGTFGLFAIVFAESGLMFGFFLPGDSLLFTAGLLAFKGTLAAVPLVWVGCFVAAVAGDQVGYWIGHHAGPRIFNRPDSRLFKHEFVEKSEAFFEKHGSKTIILARFVPIVRAFAPVIAGVSKMEYRTYLFFDVIGGFLWTALFVFGGYLLGNTIGPENVDKYFLPIIGLIILVSVAPVANEYRKHRKQKSALAVDETV